jgi:hypothetical protein
MFKINDVVGFIDQEASAPVLAVAGDQVLVAFGPRWINCSDEPSFIGCANTTNPKLGDLVEVYGVPGHHEILGRRDGDVLVDTGPTWYDTETMELR